MSMYPRLLGIAAVVFGFGLSGHPPPRCLEGVLEIEIDRQDRPALSYYDTRGRRIFGIACGVHFEMNAVYPGAAPKEAAFPARARSPTVRRRWTSPATSSTNPEARNADRSAVFQPGGAWLHPELDKDKWARWKIASSIFWTRAAADDLGRGQKLRAAGSQGAALPGALPANLLKHRRKIPCPAALLHHRPRPSA